MKKRLKVRHPQSSAGRVSRVGKHVLSDDLGRFFFDKLPSVGLFPREQGHVFSAFSFHENSGSRQENRIVCLLFGFICLKS